MLNILVVGREVGDWLSEGVLVLVQNKCVSVYVQEGSGGLGGLQDRGR